MEFKKVFNIILKVWLLLLLVNGLVVGSILAFILSNKYAFDNMDMTGYTLFGMLILIVTGDYLLIRGKRN